MSPTSRTSCNEPSSLRPGTQQLRHRDCHRGRRIAPSISKRNKPGSLRHDPASSLYRLHCPLRWLCSWSDSDIEHRHFQTGRTTTDRAYIERELRGRARIECGGALQPGVLHCPVLELVGGRQAALQGGASRWRIKKLHCRGYGHHHCRGHWLGSQQNMRSEHISSRRRALKEVRGKVCAQGGLRGGVRAVGCDEPRSTTQGGCVLGPGIRTEEGVYASWLHPTCPGKPGSTMETRTCQLGSNHTPSHQGSVSGLCIDH